MECRSYSCEMPRERERERPDNINLRLQLDRTDLVVSTVTVCVCVCVDLLAASVNSVKPPALAVKRINWEKLDQVDENTVWAKVTHSYTRSLATPTH